MKGCDGVVQIVWIVLERGSEINSVSFGQRCLFSDERRRVKCVEVGWFCRAAGQAVHYGQGLRRRSLKDTTRAQRHRWGSGKQRHGVQCQQIEVDSPIPSHVLVRIRVADSWAMAVLCVLDWFPTRRPRLLRAPPIWAEQTLRSLVEPPD